MILGVVSQGFGETARRMAGAGTQLALFASQLTSDPHYFDQHRPARQLLLHTLSHYFSVEKPNSTFAEAELLYRAGLFNP